MCSASWVGLCSESWVKCVPRVGWECVYVWTTSGLAMSPKGVGGALASTGETGVSERCVLASSSFFLSTSFGFECTIHQIPCTRYHVAGTNTRYQYQMTNAHSKKALGTNVTSTVG